MKTKTLIIITAMVLWIIVGNVCFGQEPLRNYSVSPEKLKQVNTRYETAASVFSKDHSKKGIYVSKEILEIPGYIKVLDSTALLLNDGPVFAYIDSVVKRIITSNQKLLNDQYFPFLYRTITPNAASLGEGVVLINLGLISNLKNEGELAFILCHELAHDINKDVVQSISRTGDYLMDPDLIKKANTIKKKKYKKRDMLKEVYLELQAGISKHSQATEYRADSLGFILFVNAGYSPEDAFSAMNMLESIDETGFQKDAELRKTFNFETYPFKDEWLVSEEYPWADTMKYEPLADSLKSHPGCRERLAKLIELSSSMKSTKLAKDKPAAFDQFRNGAMIEEVEYLTEMQQYGLGFYYCLKYKSELPQSNYIKQSVLNCLLEIRWAAKQHKFSNVVDFPDREYSKQYNQLLIFLHNLNSQEMKELCNNYFVKNIPDINDSDYSKYLSFLLNNENYTNESISDFCGGIKEGAVKDYYNRKLKHKLKTSH